MAKKQEKKTGVAAAMGRHGASRTRRPHPPRDTSAMEALRELPIGDELRQRLGDNLEIVELTARYPSSVTEPLSLLSQILRVLMQMSELGFVSAKNIAEVMAIPGATLCTWRELERARAAGEMTQDECDVSWRQKWAEGCESARFSGTHEGHQVVASLGLIGDAIGWKEISIYLDDRLGVQVFVVDAGVGIMAWFVHEDAALTAADNEWLCNNNPVELTDPPEGLADVVASLRRFMAIITPILGIEAVLPMGAPDQ